jgi:hypothetical protein
MSCQNAISIVCNEQRFNTIEHTSFNFMLIFYRLNSLKTLSDYGPVYLGQSVLRFLTFLLNSACQNILGFLAAPCYKPCSLACQLLYSFPLVPT